MLKKFVIFLLCIVTLAMYSTIADSIQVAIATEYAPSSPNQIFIPPPPPMPVQLEERVIDPLKPMIALTFDDGPHRRHTLRIVETFEAYGGRATFFVLGRALEDNAELIKRMGRNGFEVVGHTWHHVNLTNMSEEEIARETIETHSAIEALIGSIPHIFRPPFGAQNATVRRVAKELGFAIIYWSVDSWDWYVRNADMVAYKVLRDVSDGDIVVLHDPHPTTAAAMEQVVPELIARGYQLVTVSELLYHRGVVPEAGVVYRYAPPR